MLAGMQSKPPGWHTQGLQNARCVMGDVLRFIGYGVLGLLALAFFPVVLGLMIFYFMGKWVHDAIKSS